MYHAVHGLQMYYARVYGRTTVISPELHMALPPQLNNVLARGQSIETCPRCGRLIYRKEWLEAQQTTTETPKA